MNAYRITAIIVSAGFGLYALARLAGGVLLAAHSAGLTASPKLTSAMASLSAKLPDMNAKAFVPLPLTAYMGVSLLMGAILLAGAILGMMGRLSAMLPIYTYFAIFALMFINYRIVNEKTLHLLVGLIIAAGLHVLLVKGNQPT